MLSLCMENDLHGLLVVEVVRSTTEEHNSSGLAWHQLIDLFAETPVSASRYIEFCFMF